MILEMELHLCKEDIYDVDIHLLNRVLFADKDRGVSLLQTFHKIAAGTKLKRSFALLLQIKAIRKDLFRCLRKNLAHSEFQLECMPNKSCVITVKSRWSSPSSICLQRDGGKRMGLNFDRVKYWLSVGAQPSDPVQHVLFRAGLLPPPPMLAMGRKGGPRDTRPVDPLTGRFVTPNNPSNTDQPKGTEGGENEAEV